MVDLAGQAQAFRTHVEHPSCDDDLSVSNPSLASSCHLELFGLLLPLAV